MNRIIFISFCIVTLIFAQELQISKTTSGESMRHLWRASWITHPKESGYDFGIFHFRRTFELTDTPEKFIIFISADNRYRLFVNGDLLNDGPARDDLSHWPYDTIDISSFLRKGKNVIAVQVVNFGEYKSGGQFSEQTALILQAQENPTLNTNSEWKVKKNEGIEALPITPQTVPHYYETLGFYAGGPCEILDGSKYPWGWQELDFDDHLWKNAREIRKGVGRGFPWGSTWFLVPRAIKMLESKVERITTIERSNLSELSDGFIHGGDHLVIPAQTEVSILLDHKKLTMGYPELLFSKGKNADIKIRYAEALFDNNFLKGNRNQIEGKNIYGLYDVVKADGGNNRLFRPSWIRAFRFVQLNITTAQESLIIHDFYNNFTAYPLEEKAHFESNDTTLQNIWQASWRSLQLCARETYFSDAYFEQMQYIGDTRVQALATIVVSGDISLFKNALRQFDESRIPEGLTQSRYPARELQIIPTYSLIYIAMVHDYFMYTDDLNFVNELLPGVQSILAWFEAKIDDTGLLTHLDWWNFCDWAPEFSAGIPPGADDGYSTLVTLQYVYALQKAAEIFEYVKKAEIAETYLAQADRTKKSIRENCFEENVGMYAETPDKKQFSQHSNIFAILTDTHPRQEQQNLMAKILDNPDLIQTTLYFKFYLFEALSHCGFGERYSQQLNPWRDFIKLGLTTFPEENSEKPRSDCHPWSASPCYHLLSLTAGIRPAQSGFKKVKIEPQLGNMEYINVTYPHDLGTIEVNLQKTQTGIKGKITLPEGVDGIFSWQGKFVDLKSGKQNIEFLSHQ